MKPSSDTLTNDKSPTRVGLIDLIKYRIPACVAGIALSLTGCSVQADSAPKQTAEITASAQPGAESSPIPIDQAETSQASHLEKEMQAYLDALQDPNEAAKWIGDKLQEPSTVKRTAKPEILESAPLYNKKTFNLEEKSLEGYSISELGIKFLEHHPELQKDGVSLADLYNSFVLVKDPMYKSPTDEEPIDKEAWLNDGARDVIAAYYSQMAAIHNAPFGPETTEALRALLAKDPNSPALALPMIERELALEAATTRDYEAVIKKFKQMATNGFEDQIAMTKRILNRPDNEAQDPVDFWPMEIFVNNIQSPFSPYGIAWLAGSLRGKNPVIVPQKGNKQLMSYPVKTRVHGVDINGKLKTGSEVLTTLVVDINDETGEVTIIPGVPSESPLPKVPLPKDAASETDANRIS